MKYDFHLHTNFSACANPENSLTELLQKLRARHIDVASITDHDTCLAHVILQYRGDAWWGGTMIPGMECDVVSHGLTYELLAYDFDVIKIFNWSYQTYGTLAQRQQKIWQRLVALARAKGLHCAADLPLTAKYAHQCLYENLVHDPANHDFFTKYPIKSASEFYRLSTTDPNFPLYIDMGFLWPQVSDVVAAIHDAGGVVVLAHPFNYQTDVDPKILLDDVLQYHFDGVEVFHSSANAAQRAELLQFCQAHHLLVTGGSDYHARPGQDVGVFNVPCANGLVKP